MTYMLFFGCMFVAYGAPVALFLQVISNKAQLFIVTISSAFFWLLAVMISSIIYLIPPLQGVYWFHIPVGVVIVEVARLLFFHFYQKAERSFLAVATNTVTFPLSDLSSAIAAGFGFGIIHSLLFYGTLLADGIGPGTLFSKHCPDISVFVFSAWLAFIFIMLHIFFMIIAFDGYRRNSMLQIFCVLLTHMIAAILTAVNTVNNGCLGVMPLEFSILIATAVWTYFTIHQADYRSKRRNV